jgi:hypothetical protein
MKDPAKNRQKKLAIFCVVKTFSGIFLRTAVNNGKIVITSPIA